MPGPVDSPSLDAIEASINQTKSDNLYFVANVTDGKGLLCCYSGGA